jgi:hypothetical protein
MSDPVSLGAIIVSVLTALGGIITALHIKRMRSGCCSCETSTPENSIDVPNNTPIATPAPSPNIQRKEIMTVDV